MDEHKVNEFPPPLRPEIMSRHNIHLIALKEDIDMYERVGRRAPDVCEWLLTVFENIGFRANNVLFEVKVKIVVIIMRIINNKYNIYSNIFILIRFPDSYIMSLNINNL